MRALTPLTALLLAATSAACPFGYPGHAHPSSAQAAAAAQPLPAGRCGGDAPAPSPPKGGTPIDLRARPYQISNADLAAWLDLGYRVDPTGTRLLDPAGAPLTLEGRAFLDAPWDAAAEKLSVDTWNNLMYEGYRLDERTCRLNGPDSKPISRVAVEYTKLISAKQATHVSLERLLAAIRMLAPNAPVPAKVRAMAEEVRSAGVTLPDSVLAVLKRPDATVAALRGPATATYDGLQRYFDGQIPLSASLGQAVRATGGAAERRAPYLNSAEQEFGRMLQNAFRAELSRNSVGAALLARFARDRRNGEPNVLILKSSQRPEDGTSAASYYPSNDTMVINHWTVAEVARLRAPAGKRAEVEPLLSDPAKLMAFVAKDPALMKAVIQELEVEYFHELLHAEQSRRTRVDDEAVRGNLPQANALDKEREAHREHCRYLFAKASYDPAAVHAARWRDYCAGMLRDPDKFQDEVTRNYLSTFTGSATGAEILQMQEVRRTAASAPAGGWLKAARHALKRIGLRHGDEALADFNRDVRARNAAFNAGIADFRDLTASRMSEGLRAQPGAALRYYALNPNWQESIGAGAFVEDAIRWAVANKNDAAAFNDRLAVAVLASSWLRAHAQAPSREFEQIREADYRVAAERYMAYGRTLSGPDRQRWYDAAEQYASMAGDKALIAQIRAQGGVK